jgi:hypothetical protein
MDDSLLLGGSQESDGASFDAFLAAIGAGDISAITDEAVSGEAEPSGEDLRADEPVSASESGSNLSNVVPDHHSEEHHSEEHAEDGQNESSASYEEEDSDANLRAALLAQYSPPQASPQGAVEAAAARAAAARAAGGGAAGAGGAAAGAAEEGSDESRSFSFERVIKKDKVYLRRDGTV